MTKSLLPKSETSELASLNKGIAEQRWQNAKTYEKTAPHEYFIKSWNPKLFSRFLKAIELNGKDEIFSLFGHEKMYRYIYLGKYRYWQDGVVLNRTKADKITHKKGVSEQKNEKV